MIRLTVSIFLKIDEWSDGQFSGKSLADLNETTALDGLQFKKSIDHALFYNLVFDKEIKFPKILESIKIDLDLHVQQQYNGIPQYLYHNGLCKDIMLDWKKLAC